eukprot:gene28820-35792_t
MKNALRFAVFSALPGVGSPGTLQEVFRGYLGDKSAPEVAERYPGVIPNFLSGLF